MFGPSFNLIDFVFWAVAIVIAITVHEFAHAFAAERLGDPTPRLMGRLTLNPLAHLDPLGTIMLLIAHFGWGKPVQFDPFNLRHPQRDAAIISLAGPASNLVFAALFAILYRIIPIFGHLAGSSPAALIFMVILGLLYNLVVMNVVLAIFNLVPVHPLDGFKIVGGLLPEEQARQWYELERYGWIFLILLVLPIFGGASPISNIISPVINFFLSVLLPATPVI